ncbi:MAG: ComF family protein [Deltaproteobacteria bacterium]|nr:ComF family protein [Deltaproteobacteria bacterium]
MQILRSALRFPTDLLCPERCAACDALVHPIDLLCAACLVATRRLGPPECPGCGAPRTTDARCALCAPPDAPIRTARAWAAYDGSTGPSPVARAIARLKYQGARRLGRRFATVLTSRVSTADAALVIPVPLHPRRLRARGFNQSAVIARHLARDLGRPVGLGAVVRVRDTPSQVGSTTVAARAANVAGAFAVPHPATVRDRPILLVDDVWTSGATVRAVARCLRDAGATAVDVVTIARVL